MRTVSESPSGSDSGMDAEASRRRAEACASPFHEEEWERCTADLQAARTADEEALQARARAERDLEDLTKRHIRFMELEERVLAFNERASACPNCSPACVETHLLNILRKNS